MCDKMYSGMIGKNLAIESFLKIMVRGLVIMMDRDDW